MRNEPEEKPARRTIHPPWLAAEAATGTSGLLQISNASSMTLRTSSPSSVPRRLSAFATALMGIPVEVQERPS
jgi:hypothetical protein